ncbi:MAG: carbamoyltransferase C-terminal domain-containing protein [Planctomycetota bacterium]
MKVLGISCSFWHDPSAALMIDGRTVAVVEEERFTREKHAPDTLPIESARYCLREAGLRPEDVDLVAYSWSPEPYRATRFRYARGVITRRPKSALRALLAPGRHQRGPQRKLTALLEELGIPQHPVAWIPHHLAHAGSAYHLSRYDDAAVLSIDGMGEMASALFGRGTGPNIEEYADVLKPDSLGLFYAAITDYLGFAINDGEFKVMGMASYGDPNRYDLSDLIRVVNGRVRMDLDQVWPKASKRYEGRRFGRQLVERLGPPREDSSADEPYIHIAAAAQRVLEEVTLQLIDHHLSSVLEETRTLCFAGGCALNVSLNRRILDHPLVDRLFVPPVANDAGTALGAAACATAARGVSIEPLCHAYFGPDLNTDEIVAASRHRELKMKRVEDTPAVAAEILATGEPVAWCQGRMECGPRALGHRSILGHPGYLGVADTINEQIKFRERWRPFCPSILEERGAEILGTDHPSPFMTYSFEVTPEWRERIPEVVHIDGTARPQLVNRDASPLYHRLIREFEKRTGLPCVLNTSLNRAGEPLVATPEDAVTMFLACDLRHLFVGDHHFEKIESTAQVESDAALESQ